ncbi:MAG: transcriptional regulator [Paenibacillus sp.]|nr:transcriptional regulator [Paenibacillus sp.]
MARESFDKEVQFLRLLALTSGAYSRQQFAERLGISIHTFDKTIKRLKEIVGTVHGQLPEEQGKELSEAVRYSYYDCADPMLLFLFRAKSLKESESERISMLLAALNNRPFTAMELLDLLCGQLPASSALPDEKTVRSDLKYLEEVGVIRKEAGPRPYRYRLDNEFIMQLSEEELYDLYDFVDVMTHTQVPSVQGYMLRDGLKKHFQRGAADKPAVEPFLYKYHYYSRILDEAHLFFKNIGRSSPVPADSGDPQPPQGTLSVFLPESRQELRLQKYESAVRAGIQRQAGDRASAEGGIRSSVRTLVYARLRPGGHPEIPDGRHDSDRRRRGRCRDGICR